MRRRVVLKRCAEELRGRLGMEMKLVSSVDQRVLRCLGRVEKNVHVSNIWEKSSKFFSK